MKASAKPRTMISLGLLLAILSIACVFSNSAGIQERTPTGTIAPAPEVTTPAAGPSAGRAAQESATSAPPGQPVKNVIYRQLEGFNPADTSLDIYPVEDGQGLPVLIYVHGGGWSNGNKSNVSLKPKAFNQAGYIFISINYRLIPDVDVASEAEDIAAAIAWVHDQISEYGGDPERLFLMGHSAGAHLVSLVGVDARYLEGEGLSLQALKGIIALDTQAYNLPALLTTQSGVEGGIYDRAFGKDPQTWELLSPARYIEHRGSFPPFLVAYSGAAGDRANQSINFVEALEAAGAYAELLPAPDKTHSQINRQIGEPGDAVTQAIFQFLTTMLAED